MTELTRRPGQATALPRPARHCRRDVAAGELQGALLDELEPPLTEGARIVVRGKPGYCAARGTLTFAASDDPAGRRRCAARPDSRRCASCWPPRDCSPPIASGRCRSCRRKIGLITGRSSAAEHDVVENSQRRWPAVTFRIESVAVQGAYAVTEVIDALHRLEKDPTVDVIVIARGGGSMEDLLPFSDESLIRAVAACFTPIVSAIGHETDIPLARLRRRPARVDPTDAAKRVVPDVAEELRLIGHLRDRARRCVSGRIDDRAASARPDAQPTVARRSVRRPRGVVSGCSTAARERSRRAMLAASPQSSAESPRFAPRSPRSPRRRPSTAGTPSCSAPTDPSRATPKSLPPASGSPGDLPAAGSPWWSKRVQRSRRPTRE